jgi:F0F1-type ATP synthase membrane subunit b/b'
MNRTASHALRVMLLSLSLAGIGITFTAPSFAAPPSADQESQSAQETESHRELIFDIVNFVLLVGVLVYLYRKQGRGFYDERSKSIRENLEEGRRALEDSRAKLAAAEEKLAHFEEEVAALKKRAEEDIVRERERTRQAAGEEVQKVREMANVQIQAATNAAKLELRTYVVEQALDQAGGLIRQRLDEKNRRKMVSFFLDDLKTKLSKN